MATPYSELPDDERESDREQVRRYLPLIARALRQMDEMTTKARDMIVTALLNQALFHADRATKLVHGPVIMKHKELEVECRELSNIIKGAPHIFFGWEE